MAAITSLQRSAILEADGALPLAVPASPRTLRAKGEFDRAFQIDVLALMTKSYSFLICASDIVGPELFEDEVLGWFFTTMRDHFKKTRKLPTEEALWRELDRAGRAGRIEEKALCAYVDVFVQLRNPRPARDYDIDDVVTFCLARSRRPAATTTKRSFWRRTA